MRVGVFGGTFDPVHVGHLILAEQCREQAQLDQVLFVPAARPPHKREVPLTPFAQRAEMLALAVAGQPAFRVEELEKDRPGPSYTADTLADLRRRQAAAELFLLVGADTLHDLPSWYEPARIAEQATLLVVARPGWDVPAPDALGAALGLPRAAALRQQLVQSPLIDLRSRDLRNRVAAARSIRYLVPRAVEAYIADKGLYRSA